MTTRERFQVKVDGIQTTLTFDSYSGNRGYQYLTPGNAASHAFASPLIAGTKFRTGGHWYEILAEV